MLSFLKNRVPMDGVATEMTPRGEAGYDIIATARLHDEELNATAVIECLLSLPGTPYSKTKITTYYPGKKKFLTHYHLQKIVYQWVKSLKCGMKTECVAAYKT